MTRNLGNADRILRVFGALGAAVGAITGPFSLAVRLGVFGATAVYLLATALAGSCVGYRMMGKSTCPRAERT